MKVALLLVITVSACTSINHKENTVSVLEDVTEKHFLVRPDSASIASRFGLENNPWQPAIFRYGTLSSLRHTERHQYRIKGESSLMSNSITRRGTVEEFHRTISKILTSGKDSTEHLRSNLWLPILEEIQQLKDHPQAELYIFSDGIENSELFSLSNWEDVKLLAEEPVVIHQRFIEVARSFDLSENSTQVFFVYRPESIEEDRTFTMIKRLYEGLFHELEIQVTFVSNLNVFGHE